MLLLAISSLFVAQATGAAVTGDIRNEQTGAAVAGAVVSLGDLDRTALTDAAGRYILHAVPAGPQHIRVRAIGYEPHMLHALVPASGELRLNINLRPLPARLAAVRVRAPVAMRGVEARGRGQLPDRELSAAALRNHPLLAEPDAILGVAGGEIVVQPETPAGLHVRGGSSDHVAYVLDGIPVFSPYHAIGLFGAWNPDALDHVRLIAGAPSASNPDALAGAFSAVTKTPGARLGAQLSASNTQARATIDGPLGPRAGFLLSARTSLNRLSGTRAERSYARGTVDDWIAKTEARVAGGVVRLIGYTNHNDIRAAASVTDPAVADARANEFEWTSQSVGASWERATAAASTRVVAWRANSDVGATWVADTAAIALAAARRDAGFLIERTQSSEAASFTAGVRLDRIRTRYAVTSDSARDDLLNVSASAPVGTAFAHGARRFGDRWHVDGGASLAVVNDNAWFAPRARLEWTPSERVTLSGGYARTHQYAQSLRNSESIVGIVFPADIYMSSGSASGIPVAHNDQVLLAASFAAAPGVRYGVQAYAREFDGVALVAPRAGEPFATTGFVIGDGTSRGVSLDAGVSRARWGALASYGLQSTRRAFGDSSYVPEHGMAHVADAGVIVFPSATMSVRVGVTGVFGRRGAIGSGRLEFESCNLVDAGCEFAGSPDYTGAELGSARLPDYVRVDAGFSKHWHIHVGSRETQFAVFGSLTNILGRRNVLTQMRDPATGRLASIGLRPFAPLVVGVDWRF